MSEEKYYNYGTNSYCDYLILPNSVELLMLETANIQQHSPVSAPRNPDIISDDEDDNEDGMPFLAFDMKVAYRSSKHIET